MALTTEQKDRNLKLIARASVIAELRTGCPAVVSAAQCILESGWLRVAPGNNCFGIKNTDRFVGEQYTITKEWINGEWKIKRLAFEVYPTLEDCFTDHAYLITGGFPGAKRNCYAPAFATYQATHDLGQFITGISKYYATDPEYDAKITRLVCDRRVIVAIEEARKGIAHENVANASA